MRKNIVAIIFAVLASVAIPLSASAHILKIDNSMGAVLHILPDDAPMAGVATTYEITYQEYSGNFRLDDCGCTIDFIKDGTTVGHQTLTGAQSNISHNTYTFMQPGVYDFKVTGTPKSGATFPAFTVDYMVRIDGQEHIDRPVPIILWVGIGMLVGLVLLYANSQSYIGKPRKKVKREKNS